MLNLSAKSKGTVATHRSWSGIRTARHSANLSFIEKETFRIWSQVWLGGSGRVSEQGVDLRPGELGLPRLPIQLQRAMCAKPELLLREAEAEECEVLIEVSGRGSE